MSNDLYDNNDNSYNVNTDTNSANTQQSGIASSREQKVRSFKLQLDDSFYEDTFGDETQGSANVKHDFSSGAAVQNITSYSSDEKKAEAEAAQEKEQEKPNLTKKEKKLIKKRRKAKARKSGCLFKMVWLVMVVLVGVLVGQFLMVGVNDMLAINRTDASTITIDISDSTNLDAIADTLVDNGIINNKQFFKLYAKITNNDAYFLQGTYELRKNMDYQAIAVFLQTKINRMDTVEVQFSEGMNVLEISKKLEENEVCNAEEFLAMANSNAFDEDYPFIASIKNASKRYYKLEGYLFPDTYEFYKNEDPESVIRRFLANYRNKMYETKTRVEGFEKKVNIEKQAKKIGMSMEDLLTLASIIQAEAATEEDMYYISSIFHNRLDTLDNDGVSIFGEGGLCYLGSDATYFYPYRNKASVPKEIRKNYVSKYDTYTINKGLPAGPVCNPGMAAINAALYPYDTDYYYFCHKASTDGSAAEPFYARTIEGHNDNLYAAGLS